MKNKWLIGTIFISLAALMLLCAIYIKMDKSPMLIARPKEPGLVAAGQLKDLSDEEILLSCRRDSGKIAEHSGGTYEINLVETSFTYPYVTGFPTGPTGFFTEKDQDEKKSVAALNEAAAFNLFGSTDVAGLSVTIDGKLYTVTGLIYDKAKTSNIYVPITDGQNGEITLLASVSEKMGVSHESVLNILKTMGITEENCYMGSTSRANTIFRNKIAICLAGTTVLALLLLAAKSAESAGNHLALIKHINSQMYFGEALKSRPKAFIKAAFWAILTPVLTGLAFAVFLYIWEAVMTWNAWDGNIAALSHTDQRYLTYHIFTNILLCLYFAGMFIALFILKAKKSIFRKESPWPA